MDVNKSDFLQSFLLALIICAILFLGGKFSFKKQQQKGEKSISNWL